MEIDKRSSDLPRWPFWLRALYVRLRFFLFVACLAALFALWPWLTAWWDRTWAGWATGSHEAAVGGASEFFCPMDPGVVSAWPAICPICNMDLIRRQKSDAQLLPEGVVSRMQYTPYRLSLAGVRTTEVTRSANGTDPGPERASAEELSSKESTEPVSVFVPATAIVYRDQQPLVYVESMPGMFDAVPVTLSGRHADQHLVLGKLRPGQRVAVMGALLLDAESRLNPNISTQYFGAAQPSLASSPPSLPAATTAEGASGQDSKKQVQLSAEDQRLVDQQKKCPVTKAALGSMGTPVFVEVKDRRIALCCAGCRGRVMADPDKYLQWLDQSATDEKPTDARTK